MGSTLGKLTAEEAMALCLKFSIGTHGFIGSDCATCQAKGCPARQESHAAPAEKQAKPRRKITFEDDGNA